MNHKSLSQWAYSGFWGKLTDWFILPKEPPTLPILKGEKIHHFQPATGWLEYEKFHFWVILLIIDICILIGWLLLVWNSPFWGGVLAPVALVLAVVPDILAYLAIYLKFDSTWYVMTEKSIRIRRGIWVLQEVTITFANIQNIKVEQGPLQRYFGFANVLLETAGGGGGAGHPHDADGMQAHRAVIEGVDNASEIRKLLLQRLDKEEGGSQIVAVAQPTSSSTIHLDLLKEIRDQLKIFVKKRRK
ncbi:PH domain-containing protein [Candidatus Riflebacteria bacterium]